VVSPEIKREIYKKQAEELEEKAPVYITPERKRTPEYLKYAAIFLLGISVLGIGNRLYNQHRNKKIIATAERNQKEVEKKIENATFVISKPLPTIDLQVTTHQKVSKSYHVIAGAFRYPENAEKKLIVAAQQEEAFKRRADELKTTLAYYTIKSPFDGVLSARFTNLGDLAAPGKSLFNVEDRSAIKLTFSVPQDDLNRVKDGVSTSFVYAGKTYQAKHIQNRKVNMANMRRL